MPRAVINVDIPDVYDQRASANAAAEGIANIIGDQPDKWEISISEPKDASGWLVEVRGRGRQFALVFDGEDQRAAAIVEQFRLDLTPWIARG